MESPFTGVLGWVELQEAGGALLLFTVLIFGALVSCPDWRRGFIWDLGGGWGFWGDCCPPLLQGQPILSCACGHMTQTRWHILKECPKYLNQQPLLGMGRNTQLERLVRTEKGITHLMKFISITKAINKHSTICTAAPDPNNKTTDEGRQGEE